MMIYAGLKRILGFALLFAMVCMLTGCGAGNFPFYFENKVQDEVPIDVLKPGTLAIPDVPRKIGLLYLPEDYKKVKLLYVNSDDDPDDTLNHELGNDMLNGVYDGVFQQINGNTPFEIIETKDTLQKGDSLTALFGRRLSEKWQVDGILTVNRLHAEFKYVFLDEGQNESFAEQVLLAGLALEIFMYDYAKDKITTWTDTLGDHFYSKTVLELMDYSYERTPISEVDGYLGFELGKAAINKVFPHWESVERNFYGRAHQVLRKAKRHVIAGEWEAAGHLWNENINSENRVLAKHSKYNLILFQEINNNLNEALELAKQYDKQYRDQRVKKYIATLEKRIEENKILDKQLDVIR